MMSQELQRRPGGAADGAGQTALPDPNAVRGQTAPQISDDANDGEASVDMVELFFHVLSKIHYVIIAAVVGTLLAFLYVHFGYQPTYQATAKLYIQNTSGISVSVGDMTVASNLTKDYQEVFSTWEVQESVRAAMLERTAGWNGSAGTFATYADSEFDGHTLTVSNPANTRVLYINVRHSRGEVAIEIANAYAAQALEFIMSHMGNAYEPTEFSAAKYAKTVGMTKVRCLILGFAAGAGLMLAALVMMFLLDDRPHTPDDIARAAGIPTLAVVPREQGLSRSVRRVQKEVRR